MKYMNSSAGKTFHKTNQARSYMDLCDGGLYLQIHLYKNSKWFEYSNTIKAEDILNFNSMKISSGKLNFFNTRRATTLILLCH